MAVNIRKQLTNSGAAAGTDLDSIFKARTSAAGANVNIRDASGVDLAQRYEPRGSTPKVADVGYRNGAGSDISNVFKDIASSVAKLTGLDGANFSRSQAFPNGASLTLTFLTTGGWDVRNENNAVVAGGSGDWLTPAGGGSASGYAVLVDNVVVLAGSAYNNGAVTYQTLSANRTVFDASETNVNEPTTVKFDVHIRRVSDSVVVAEALGVQFNANSVA